MRTTITFSLLAAVSATQMGCIVLATTIAVAVRSTDDGIYDRTLDDGWLEESISAQVESVCDSANAVFDANAIAVLGKMAVDGECRIHARYGDRIEIHFAAQRVTDDESQVRILVGEAGDLARSDHLLDMIYEFLGITSPLTTA